MKILSESKSFGLTTRRIEKPGTKAILVEVTWDKGLARSYYVCQFCEERLCSRKDRFCRFCGRRLRDVEGGEM